MAEVVHSVVGALSIDRQQALAVVVSTVGIYLSFVVLLRLLGQRLVTGFAAFDLAATMALGALVGRTILGNTPVLAAGVLGLVTLAALETLLARLRDTRLGARLFSPRPVLLVADGRLVEHHLRRTRLVADEIGPLLRLAGVRSLDEVAAMVLEPGGAVSVLRVGEPLDRDLLQDVRGHDLLPDRLFRATS